MKSLADRFLTDTDKVQIRSAVAAAENETSGEIVPMVVSSSYEYPVASILGATLFALPAGILLTEVIGGWFWMGGQENMWLFAGLFTLLYFLFHGIIERVPGLKRLFLSRSEIEAEVEEAATVAFFKEGLYRTRDRTGVLIFISVFERKVWVLADGGINEKVGRGQWSGVVSHIVTGIREGRQGRAICEAVEQVGEMLKAHFPKKADDRNELDNLIVGK